MMAVIKVIEVIGCAPDSFETAVQNTVAEAAKTVRDIVGIEVVGWTCKVNQNKVIEYRTTCKLAFKVESDRE